MKSQKQSNRSPRPFKNKGADGRWAGNGGKNAFFPPPKKPIVKVAKSVGDKNTKPSDSDSQDVG